MHGDIAVLVVDDEPLSRETSVRQLGEAGYRAEAVEDAHQALASLRKGGWDVVLCDLRMAGMDGIELVRAIRLDYPDTDVVLVAAFASVETAVAALHEGAADYLTKPFHFRDLEHKLRKLGELRKYRRELRALRAHTGLGTEWFGIVGASASSRVVFDQIRELAPQTAPVLIAGEPGTGKELVARALHHQGPRASEPFVIMACSAVPDELADTELFGTETGASVSSPGALVRAEGGTLLLDDIDHLPPETQARLCDFLQAEAHAGKSDVRVVATSISALGDAVSRARFHRGLFGQFRGQVIQVQPLRERTDDIIPLTEHLLRRFAARTGRPLVAVSPRVAEILQQHRWPGNVRELSNLLRALVVSCSGRTVDVEQLPAYLRGAAGAAEELFTLHLEGCETIPFADVVSCVEASLLAWALRQSGGQQRRAAELLGLPRTTFQSKLRQRLVPGQRRSQQQAETTTHIEELGHQSDL